MQIKVYLGDWFFNAGIIGFLNILEHAEKDYVVKKENYIQFDSEDLRNFEDDYFKYFFDKYNIAEKIKSKVEISIDRINAILQKDSIDKDDEKKIKKEIGYIKDTIKRENDKVKKFNSKSFDLIKEELNNLDSIDFNKDVNKLKSIIKIILLEISEDDINQKITSNLFKNILSDNYFGQASFLNVIKNTLNYEEQKNLMYKDYISDIVEIGYLHDFLNDKHSESEFIEHINGNKKEKYLTTDDISKLYSTLLKTYDKTNDIEQVRKEIIKKLNITCSLCGNSHFLTEEYSEKHFLPLAASSDKMKNIFWNQNVKFPMCNVCKLILFCTPAGMVNTKKIVLEYKNGEKSYEEKDILAFVNYDTDVNTLKRTNVNFQNLSKKEKANNPYAELILNLVEENKQISEWQLQNIFIAEFESKYREFSRLETFNIKRYVATFFRDYSKSILQNITDYKYKLQIVDYILKNKNINLLINERIRQEIVNQTNYGYNSYLSVKIRMILNLLKKGDLEVKVEIEKSNKKVYAIYMCGIELHNIFKQKNEENKLNGYTYKMLNAVKAGKSSEFMDMLIRLYMSVDKDVPSIFLEIMQETNLDFATIGHSFISGLISNYKEKVDGGNNNG